MTADAQQHWVPMGYIKGAFGVKGWVKVHADTEYADSLLSYPEWRLNKNGSIRTVSLESGKLAGDGLQVKFSGVDDRDAAASLRGFTVEINRAEFDPAGENEFYWADLVGMTVNNRQGMHLGTVSGLMETGAHDILIVRKKGGETLIPFVSRFIDEVDQTERIITADWDEDF